MTISEDTNKQTNKQNTEIETCSMDNRYIPSYHVKKKGNENLLGHNPLQQQSQPSRSNVMKGSPLGS